MEARELSTLPSISFVRSSTDMKGEAMSFVEFFFCTCLESPFLVSTFNGFPSFFNGFSYLVSSFLATLEDFFFSFFEALAYADYLRAGSTTLI